MEEGLFGKARTVLNFFSPDGAVRGNNRRRRKRNSGPAVTIFAHTLLHQLISVKLSEGTRITTASDFLCHLLDSIENHELLDRFENISGDLSAIILEAHGIPDTVLFDALGKVLGEEEDLRIVVNVSNNMSGRGSDFFTTISTFIGGLSERALGFKALLTGGPAGDSRMALGGISCITIQYDRERKGLISQFLKTDVRTVANKCRVP
jgi:hypothetical protein